MQEGVLGQPVENAWGVSHRLPGAGGESPINVWHDLESVLTLT